MTDWDAEAALLIEYLNYYVDNWRTDPPRPGLEPDPGMVKLEGGLSVHSIMGTFAAIGLVLMEGRVVKTWPLTFEAWKVKYKGQTVSEWTS